MNIAANGNDPVAMTAADMDKPARAGKNGTLIHSDIRVAVSLARKNAPSLICRNGRNRAPRNGRSRVLRNVPRKHALRRLLNVRSP